MAAEEADPARQVSEEEADKLFVTRTPGGEEKVS